MDFHSKWVNRQEKIDKKWSNQNLYKRKKDVSIYNSRKGMKKNVFLMRMKQTKRKYSNSEEYDCTNDRIPSIEDDWTFLEDTSQTLSNSVIGNFTQKVKSMLSYFMLPIK